MKTAGQIANEIKLVGHYPKLVSWVDFTNYSWKCDPDPDEHHTIAEVRIALPKTDPLYLPLMRTVATELGTRWVTYDKLTEYLGRLLSLGEHQDFVRMVGKSVKIRISQGLPVR